MVEWGKVFLVQLLSPVGLFVTLWTEACQASLLGNSGEQQREEQNCIIYIREILWIFKVK